MKEIKITKKNVKKFLKNLRQEDLKELKYFYPKNTLKKYLQELRRLNKVYFLENKKGNPIAMGGAQKEKGNKTLAQIWLLCTKDFKENKKELYKFIKNKILKFKQENDFLYNFVYKTNFKAQIWLEKLGFKFQNTQNPDFKLFYFLKGENIDIRNITRELL